MAETNILPGLNYMLAFGNLLSSREQAGAIRQQGDFQRDQFLRNAELAELQSDDAQRRGARRALALTSTIGNYYRVNSSVYVIVLIVYVSTHYMNFMDIKCTKVWGL